MISVNSDRVIDVLIDVLDYKLSIDMYASGPIGAIETKFKKYFGVYALENRFDDKFIATLGLILHIVVFLLSW